MIKARSIFYLHILSALFLLAPLPAQDPWTDIAGGGSTAKKVLDQVRKGGTPALRDLLAKGLFHPQEQIRFYCAQLLPAEVLKEQELAALLTVLVELTDRDFPDLTIPEDIQDDLNTMVSEKLSQHAIAELPHVFGWGDQEALLKILAGPTKGKKNTWAKAGKEGRTARNSLAQKLFPATDSGVTPLVAKAVLAKNWDPEERAPLYWLVMTGTNSGYPGKEAIAARLKSILKRLKPMTGRRRLFSQGARVLPLLTANAKALPQVREALLQTKDDVDTLPLWTAVRILLLRSSDTVKNDFWAAGVAPLKKYLNKIKDDNLKLDNFLFLAPALGGKPSPTGPGRQALSTLSGAIKPTLLKMAGQGEISSDLFAMLLTWNDFGILADVVARMPEEDLELLLEEPEYVFPLLPREMADKLSTAKNAKVAAMGRAALKVIRDLPANRRDKVLARLAPIPSPEKIDILREALRRKVLSDPKAYHGWWQSFVEEDNREGAKIAAKYPRIFLSYLVKMAGDRENLGELITWCIGHKITSPWQEPLPAPLVKAIHSMVADPEDMDVPVLIAGIAPFLAPGDRQRLAKVYLAAWQKKPDDLDAGDAGSDLDLIRVLLDHDKSALAKTWKGLLSAGATGRVAEVAFGGLVRLGQIPATAQIETLLDQGLCPTPFMGLRACPVRPLLGKIKKALETDGDDGWDLFLPIAWAAWHGTGPGPSLPNLPDPKATWWDLAVAGKFIDIYAEQLKLSRAEESDCPAATAIRGLALAIRTPAEKERVLTLLRPCLTDLHLGLYWDALPALAKLGDPAAKKDLTTALAQGRRFFIREHLFPWIRVDRSRRWLDFMLQRGLPGSGILEPIFLETLTTLVPGLHPQALRKIKSKLRWADYVDQALTGKTDQLVWNPRVWGWEVPAKK